MMAIISDVDPGVHPENSDTRSGTCALNGYIRSKGKGSKQQAADISQRVQKYAETK
jgi:hypothetical protein